MWNPGFNVCGIVLAALICGSIPLPANADVTLKGSDRVDPCGQVKYWQSVASQNLDKTYVLDLVGDYAIACASTYETSVTAGNSQQCDVLTIAGQAYNAAWHLETDDFARRLAAVDALHAYSRAAGSCGDAKRGDAVVQKLLDSVNQVRNYLLGASSK
jgi:hypothetical protein